MLPRLPEHSGVADLLFPPSCVLCGRVRRVDPDFCAACTAEVLGDVRCVCPRCAATVGPYASHDGGCPECRKPGRTYGFDAAIRLGLYDGQLRLAIVRLKQAKAEGIAEMLGERWGKHQRERIHALSVDVLVPVPLHWTRRLWRGYNQSEAIARGLSLVLEIPLASWWLFRTRRTPTQVGLKGEERVRNVRGAFRCRKVEALRGKHVLLVDDVHTTGATLSEAAYAMKAAGAGQVTAAALARA